MAHNKLPDLHEPDPAADAVAADWEGWMDAIGSGLDSPLPAAEPALPDASEPEPEPNPKPEPKPEPEPEPFEASVWEDEGALLTDCPPPAGFDLYEDGKPGDAFYQRYLTPAEQEHWQEIGEAAAFEDFGFSGTFYRLGRSTFFPWGSEPSEPSSLAEPDKDAGGAREPGGEGKRDANGGPAPDASGPSGAPI
ncbi:MAG TPA: hypothetical protein VGB54_06950 [Allosphingosinicella sp.]|jgi:hypothetical protein